MSADKASCHIIMVRSEVNGNESQQWRADGGRVAEAVNDTPATIQKNPGNSTSSIDDGNCINHGDRITHVRILKGCDSRLSLWVFMAVSSDKSILQWLLNCLDVGGLQV